jgi:pimeloyl-ACP methyl ester carboxylesterase
MPGSISSIRRRSTTSWSADAVEMTGPYLMHVASPAVVRDIEAIRAGLRDGKLNWLGLSYGTMLGALYAERYPKRIRTLALDGLLDRGLSEPGMLGAGRGRRRTGSSAGPPGA